MVSRVSFEVLAQPIVPGIPNIPYVQQGFFVQISNTQASYATVNIVYYATPAFVSGNPNGSVVLMANYIDGNGNVTAYPASTFLAQPVGFAGIAIPPSTTFIFGVQYVGNPSSASNLAGATPQDGLGSRGYATINVTDPNAVILPTIRQVFQNFNPQGGILDISEAAYAVPVVAAP